MERKRQLLVIRSLVFNVAFFSWTALLALAVLPFAAFISAKQMRRYAAFWMRGIHVLMRTLIGLDFQVRGLNNLPSGPCIIASKHQSAFETLIFHTIRPDVVIGLKHELTRIPLFGWYLKIADNIAIDRGGAARAMRSLIDGAKAAIAKGASILIFPEGNRRAPGAPPAYKPGVAALYLALDVPVIPVALNSGRFWGRKSFVKTPGTITVSFLPAIEPGLDRRAFMAVLAERIENETALIDPLSTHAPEPSVA